MWFDSKSNESGQWICWDFHEIDRRGQKLIGKRWMVESSLDGEAWTEIHRKTDNKDFQDGVRTASFAVSKSVECRFIRLTQTGERHCGLDHLVIDAVEFFGTLTD
jgi:hypothetical protein